ncbi:MAG: endonuclease III [Euryarchaeota archaeon]|nr:endonuclease III [Euryarchaeota archaeon]MBV1729955.1 endonuclease III [Methanobacterium sp.]MBU4547950.1 endonuclease III [Euryarchaeota archaeon]MBU4608082.1 endonuclease III [Euryarchaeota archaeon]MBV1755766.1 endonuclease III [Methanobacterium sp.]
MPERIEFILNRLKELYKLRIFEEGDPYRVLIRTILSQRTRDENTDHASAQLFSRFHSMEDIAHARLDNLEKLIKPAGFYRVKSRRIKEVSQILLDDYQGVVPDNLEELLKLPGVGRKTANCVLVFAFHKPAIPVDTHVHRISNRIGWVDTKNPDETEKKLEETFPEKYWIELNDLLVQFGQDICRPISPKHEECPISEYCDYYHGILDKK